MCSGLEKRKKRNVNKIQVSHKVFARFVWLAFELRVASFSESLFAARLVNLASSAFVVCKSAYFLLHVQTRNESRSLDLMILSNWVTISLALIDM